MYCTGTYLMISLLNGWQEGCAPPSGNMANSLQYTVASPVSQQPMTPAILSAITSPALHPQGGPPGQPAGANAAATAQANAAGGPLPAAYPYHHLPPIDMSSMAAAGLVDWSGLTYTLPAGMYAL